MSRDDEQRRVVPVTEERIHVDKQRRKTGGVRVFKTVREHEEVVDEPMVDTEVEVRRVPVGEFVDEPGHTRQEGDTTIIPVHEEVVVTEKRLRLKEEIHVVRRKVTRSRPETVEVRREEVRVERDDKAGETESSQPPERSP